MLRPRDQKCLPTRSRAGSSSSPYPLVLMRRNAAAGHGTLGGRGERLEAERPAHPLTLAGAGRAVHRAELRTDAIGVSLVSYPRLDGDIANGQAFHLLGWHRHRQDAGDIDPVPSVDGRPAAPLRRSSRSSPGFARMMRRATPRVICAARKAVYCARPSPRFRPGGLRCRCLRTWRRSAEGGGPSVEEAAAFCRGWAAGRQRLAHRGSRGHHDPAR